MYIGMPVPISGLQNQSMFSLHRMLFLCRNIWNHKCSFWFKAARKILLKRKLSLIYMIYFLNRRRKKIKVATITQGKEDEKVFFFYKFFI